MPANIPPIVARNRKHLNGLIARAMAVNGPQCDLNHIDVSGVNDFTMLFANQKKFVGDISRWDVSNATTMAYMFVDSPFNGDISRWNTGNVRHMQHMFKYANFNGDISQWDVSSVHDMESMFNRSKFDGDLSQWDTRRVQTFAQMFYNGEFSGDISGWTIQSAALVNLMFGDDQLPRLAAPNVYLWSCHLADYNPPMRPEWRAHLDIMAPLLDVLDLLPIDAAHRVHHAWMQRGVAVEMLALPSDVV